MKIALCLSGIPRCYDYHIDTIRDLFSPHEVDMFCHFWNDEMDTADYSQIADAIRPSGIMFEPSHTQLFHDWYLSTVHLAVMGRTHERTFPMWYSVHQANRLKSEYEKTHDFRYDVVCKARTDLWFPHTWTDALALIQPDTIVLPHDRHYGGYTDVVAMGDSQSMDHYSDLWNWFPRFLSDQRSFGYETTLQYYLDEYKQLTVKLAHLDYRIVRPRMKHAAYHEIPHNAYPSEPGIKT